MTAGISPPVAVTLAPAVAVVAPIPVAATFTTTGGSGSVSKLPTASAQDSPALLVAREVKKYSVPAVRLPMFPEKLPVWVPGRSWEKSQAPASTPPLLAPQNQVIAGASSPMLVTSPFRVADVGVNAVAAWFTISAPPGGTSETASRRMSSKCERPEPRARRRMRMVFPTAPGLLGVSNTSAGASPKLCAGRLEALKIPVAWTAPVLSPSRYCV